ncbi:MAG: hypothetical protein PF795_12135, partial [Kiritimatiellae bacterium]|nr:hypothetical protein [Kiritimatiellia bacterium]
MEAILLIFSGLLEGLIMAASMGIYLLGSLLVMLVRLVAYVISSARQIGKPPGKPPDPVDESTSEQHARIVSKPGPSKRRKWIVAGFGIVCGLVCAFLVFIETVGFESSVRFLARRLRAASGVEIEFEEVHGSFLKREFRFTDLEARRGKSEGVAGFDLSAAEVSGRFKGSALSIPRSMSVLEIQDLSGRILPAVNSLRDPEEGTPLLPSLLSNRPGFTVEQVRLRGCELILILPETLEEVPISIPYWEVSPLRSRFYAFDLLFRSNLDGTIGDGRILIETQGDGDGRTSRWLAEDLRVEWMSAFMSPPWNGLAEGRMDVEVRDAWLLRKDEVFIDLFWLIRFSELTLREPEGGTLREKAFQKLFVRQFRERMRDRELELGFELRVQEGEISGSMS